jgi:hypothetical protein
LYKLCFLCGYFVLYLYIFVKEMNTMLQYSKNIFGKSLQAFNFRVSQNILSNCNVLKSPKIVPQMRSNFSTKISGTTIVPKHSALPFKFLSDSTGNGVMKMPPAQNDATASVYLENPPPQHEEDKEAAAYLGVNHFYRSGGLTSFCIMKFEPVKNIPLDNYIETTKLDFYSKVPYGTVSKVDLAPAVTSHLNKGLDEAENIESAALFFDKKRVPMELQRPAELSYILKTPGGFWNVSCHSTFFNLSTHKDSLFGSMLQNLRIELKKRAPTSTTVIKAAVNTEIPITDSAEPEVVENKSKPKSASSKGPKKRPNKKGKLTHEASIGNINLTNPKDEFTIDDNDMLMEY